MVYKIKIPQVTETYGSNAPKQKSNPLRSFFMGKWYPIYVAISVLIGRFTCLEVHFAMADFLIVSIAILVCNSIRPVLPNLITFLYRIPLEHGPGSPNYSEYYQTDPLVELMPVFVLIFVLTLVIFFMRNRSFADVNFLKVPLFIPLVIFSVSFLTAGIFSGNRAEGDFMFSVFQVIVFFVLYLILYFGLRRENIEELTDYFVYIASVCAVILILEVFNLYLPNSGVVYEGVIYKFNIKFGWGIANTCGNALTLLSPLCILGVMRSDKLSRAVIYYVIAFVTMIAVAMTLSRSSILVGGVGFISAMIVSVVAGKQKRFCRIAFAGVVLIAGLALYLFRDNFIELYSRMISVGFHDNGRYGIWGVALANFKENPLFGNGHFLLDVGEINSSFAPRLAHNTLIQLLTAMGIFGLAAYIIYRAATFFPFFKRFTSTKFMMLISCAILVGASLIDNFIFWINPVFIYNICIVLSVIHCEQINNK